MLAVGLAMSASAGTLRTRFTTVLLEDLPIGYATRLRVADGARYSVENTSERDIEVRFSVQKPTWIEPVRGGPRYRPIPDIAWVTLDPMRAPVPAGGKTEVDVSVRAPDDAALVGSHFEFWLRVETVGPGAGVALLTRVRFNITAEPTEIQRQPLDAE